MAVSAAIYALKFRRKTPSPEESGTRVHTTPFDLDDVGSQAPQPNMGYVPVSSLYSTTLRPGQAPSNTPLQGNSDVSPIAGFVTPTDTTNPDSERRNSLSSQGRDPNFGGAFSPRPDSPDDEIIPNRLTNEQVAYVQSMYSLNVPVPGIAVVVERMLQEGSRTVENSSGITGIRRTATKPPSYEDS